ncbi:uncharacterized protein LOC130685873 [Daphnia carinata]|uniref:uncharacterized protein LOC130685873 n=1 Tax=Daphnia carinata TaxID=120202 RepID=UPI00257C149D|nr:uncharacterized protein LOC130685873 [Daphnia carinata]
MEAEQFLPGCAEKYRPFETDPLGVAAWQQAATVQEPEDTLTKSLIPNQTPETSQSTRDCCSSGTLHRRVDTVMEENNRMRQSVTRMAFVMTQWIHDNQEKNEQITLLIDKLKESELKRKALCQDFEALKILSAIRESEWEEERDRLATFQGNHREKTSKQVILKLQEENWKLRKTHSSAFVCRQSISR